MHEERALRGPGIGLFRQLLDNQPTLELAIGQAQTLQFLEVARVERAQLTIHQARFDQSRFELADSLHQRIDKAAEASRARERAELLAVEQRAQE